MSSDNNQDIYEALLKRYKTVGYLNPEAALNWDITVLMNKGKTREEAIKHLYNPPPKPAVTEADVAAENRTTDSTDKTDKSTTSFSYRAILVPKPPQQPTTQPSKRRLNKKIISMVLIVVVLCSALATLGYFYVDLSNRYANLQSEHTELQVSYDDLKSKYEWNSELSDAFNKPLSDEQIPSTFDLKMWLLLGDYTNSMTYSDPNFVCGDFAVMLSQHAKLKNWDMGVAAIAGTNVITGDSYAHVVNIIYTQEGWVYIEPQNDRTWCYDEGHAKMSTDYICELPDGQLISVDYYAEVVQP